MILFKNKLKKCILSCLIRWGFSNGKGSIEIIYDKIHVIFIIVFIVFIVLMIFIIDIYYINNRNKIFIKLIS